LSSAVEVELEPWPSWLKSRAGARAGARRCARR